MPLLFQAPDVMKDLRAFLRAQPDLAALHNGRVFFRMPDPGRYSGFPILRIYRVGGGPNPGLDLDPLGNYHISIETWGGKAADYDMVRQTVGTLETVLATLAPGPINPPNGTTYIASTWVSSSMDAPDPETGNPRFITDFIAIARGL